MEAPSKPALPQVSSIFDGLSIDAVRKDPPMSVGAPYAMPTQLLVNPNTTDAMLEEQYKEISNGVPFQAVTVLGAQAGSFIRGVSPTDLGLDMVLDPKIKEEDRDYVTSRVPKPRIARAGKASMMNRLGLRDVTEIHRAGHPEMAEAALRSLVTSFTAAKEVQIASIANDDVVLEVVHHDLLPVRLERLLALVEYNRIPGMIVKNTKYDDVMADAASTGTPKPMVRRFYIPTVQDMLVALWGPDPVTGSMKLGRGASWSQGETAAAKYNGREGVAPSDSPLQALMTPEEAQAIRRNIKAFQGTNGDRVAVPDSSIGTGQDQLDLSPHGPFGYLPSSERDRYDPRGLVKRLLVPKFTLTAAEAAVTNEDRAWRKSATSMLYPELSLDDGDHVEVAHRKIVRGGPPTLAAGEPFGSERYEPADLELDEAVLSTPVGAWMADSTTDPVLDQHLDLTRFDLVRDRWRLAQMQRMYGDRATFDLTVADLREVAALGYAYDEHVAAQIKGSKEPGEAMYKTQQEIRMSRLVTPSHIGCALRASTTWGDLHFATSYQSTAEMKNDAKAKEGVDWKLVRAFADAAPKVTVPKLLAVGSHGCNAGLTNDDETTLHWRITEVGTNAVWATYREIEESLAPYSGVGDAGIPAYKLSQLLMNGKRVVSAQTDASDGVPKFYGLTSLGDKKLEPYLPGTFGTRSAQWVPETGNRETEDLTDRPTDIHCVPTVRPYAQSVGRPPPPAGAIASSVAMDVDTSAEGTRKVRMVVPKGILLFTRTEVKEGLVYHGGGLGTPRYLIGTLDAVDTKLLKPPHDVGMTLANGARAIRQANGAVTSHEASAPVFEFPLSEKGRLSDKEKDGMPVADTVEKLMEAAIHYVVYHGGYWNGDPLARSVFPNYTEELYKLDQRAALKDTLVGKAKDIVRMLTQMNSRRAPTEEHSSAARMAASSTEGSLPDSRVRIGAGFLKSLMQKAVRIGARSWKFWGDDYVPGMTEDAPPPPSLEDMDASLLAMAAFGLCCSHLGDAKLPELQMKSVPGPSAAFKRLAIIMVEDAWPVALPQLWFERGYDASYWLNCFASHALLLSAPQRKYHTSLDMMASAMIVVASAASSEYHVAHELDAGSKAAFDRPVAATRMIGLGEAQRKDLPKDSLAYHVNRIPGDYMRIARERGKSMSLSDAMFTLMMGDAARQDPLSPDGPLRFDYHTATVRAVDEPPDAKSFEVDFDAPIHFDFVVDVSVGYMHAAAAMIRVVRSFGGDMDMMDRAASFGDRRAYPTGLLVHKIAEANGVGHFLENGALWNAQTLAELAVGGLVADPDDETQAYPMWRYWGGERAQIRCAFSPLDLAFPNPSPRRASDPHSPLGFRLAGKPGVGGFSAGETRTTVAYEPENYRPLPRGLDDAGALSYDFRRVSDVPMLHMIDQHAYPGVAHLWTTWPAWLKEVWPQDSFRARFKFLFHTVTGWNPRNRSHALQEPKELKHAPDLATWSQMDDFRKHQTKVLFARAAQKIVLASQRQLPRTDVPGWEMTEKVTLTFPVDHGVLAGGVGVVGKLRVKPPSKRAGGAVKGEASVEGAEEFFRVVAYRTGTPTPTKPANALFVEESVGDFSQIGLPSDQTLLEYKLSVSIGMDSPDPVVLDYVSTSTRGAKPKLFTITKAVRDAVVEAFYEGSAIEGYAFASEVLPKFHRAHFVTEAQSMKPGVGLTPGWYLTTTHKPHPTFLTTARGTALKQWTYFDSSTGRHEWCYDCHVATLDVALTSPLESTVPAFSFEFEGIDDPNDAVVSTYLRRERNVHVLHGMPTMCDGYEERIKEICHALHDVASLQSPGGRVVLERLRSFLDRAISEIAMPVPSVTGGRAADSLEPAPGDWLVWRGLMYISFYATGAFVCKQIPKFEVKSKLLMREVIRIVDAVIEDLSEDAQNTDSFEWKGILNVMELQFGQPVPPTGEVNYPSPTEVQKLAVGGLLRRDGVPLVDRYDGEWPQPLVKARPPVRSLAELPPVQRAHFLAMDTGMGKTAAGTYYALKWLAHTRGARLVLWVCPRDIVENTKGELAKWGLAAYVHVVRQDRSFTTIDYRFNIVTHEDFSNDTDNELQTMLFQKASSMFCIFDEVHRLYNASKRTTTARILADICPKYVCMSATPLEGVGAVVAYDWLDDTVPFTVNRKLDDQIKNKMVAAANCIKLSKPMETSDQTAIELVDLEDVVLGSSYDTGYQPGPLMTMLMAAPNMQKEIHNGVFLRYVTGAYNANTARAEPELHVRFDANVHAALLLSGAKEVTLSSPNADDHDAKNATIRAMFSAYESVSDLAKAMLDAGARTGWAAAAEQARVYSLICIADRAVRLALFDRARTLHMAAVLEKRRVDPDASSENKALAERQLRNLKLFQDNPTGGCFVVAHNMLEAKMLRGYCTVLQKHYHERSALMSIILEFMKKDAIRSRSLFVASDLPLPGTPKYDHVHLFNAVIRDQTSSKPTGPDFNGTPDYRADTGVVITTKNRVTGYDMHHLGCMVTGVYEGNAADRHQSRGRIKRIGQERTALYYQTVYPENTMLQLLLERHRSTDQKNASLDQVGENFLAMLVAAGKPAAAKPGSLTGVKQSARNPDKAPAAKRTAKGTTSTVLGLPPLPELLLRDTIHSADGIHSADEVHTDEEN